MNSPTPPSLWQRSSTGRCLRWLFSGSILRRVAVAVAWIVTLIALAYGFENWRGRRAWNEYRTGLAARGVELDLSAMIPKPISDDRNFAATPFVQSWFVRGTNGGVRWLDSFELVDSPPAGSSSARSGWQPTDLAAWAWALRNAESNRAAFPKVPPRIKSIPDDSVVGRAFSTRSAASAAVLNGLQSSAALLGELREAGQRPESRYPVVYDLDNPWSILLPHLAGVRGACRRLQLRACAELAAGDAAAALQDVLLGLRLVDSLQGEPFVISMLVRAGSIRLMLQPIWEGLADRRWSEPQLQSLQDRLGNYNFIADLDHSFETERAAALWTVDLMARGRFSFSQLDSDLPGEPPGVADDFIRDLVGRLAPRGWYRLEQLNYCRLLDQLKSGAIDAGARRMFPAQVAANADALERAISTGRIGKDVSGVLRHQFFAALLLPGLQNLPRKAAAAQVAVDEARLACALERYRLARGAFPESLAVLAPEWMTAVPSDPLTGTAYSYHRTDNGRFILTSVGLNRSESEDGSARTRFGGDDRIWTWEYPER